MKKSVERSPVANEISVEATHMRDKRMREERKVSFMIKLNSVVDEQRKSWCMMERKRGLRSGKRCCR